MAADKNFWKTAFQKYKDLFALQVMYPTWEPPVLYIRDPARTTRGAFHGFSPGTFAYSNEVNESDLGEIIERSGEILPATFDQTGEKCYIFNCTACYNCLNRSDSLLDTTPDGTVVTQVKKYTFHADRIGDCNLFKVPETKSIEIYAVTGRDEPEDEFYAQYHALGFTGLKFEEVWSDEVEVS